MFAVYQTGTMASKPILQPKPFDILLVEDNPADVRLTREALKEVSMPYRLEVATDGVKALQYLRGAGSSQTWNRPDLILLDWNLPRMDGSQVLREIKQDDQLREIPVVVLTTSKAAADVASAYDLRANCYITKPVNVLEFFEVILAVEQFWLKTVFLPSK